MQSIVLSIKAPQACYLSELDNNNNDTRYYFCNITAWYFINIFIFTLQCILWFFFLELLFWRKTAKKLQIHKNVGKYVNVKKSTWQPKLTARFFFFTVSLRRNKHQIMNCLCAHINSSIIYLNVEIHFKMHELNIKC